MISRIRRHIGRKDNSSFIGLDSFMDIVTNVMGALFFVIIYAALSTGLAKGKETLPLARAADTERIIFECRNNTAFYPEFEKMLEKSDEEVDKLYKEGGIANLMKNIDNIKIENEFYTHKYDYLNIANMFFQLGAVKFLPKPNAKGEDGLQIERENSKFQRELAKLDPKKHHIIFVVRTDSFPVFHTARRVAVKKGFNVGWEPKKPDDPIGFSSGGKDVPIF